MSKSIESAKEQEARKNFQENFEKHKVKIASLEIDANKGSHRAKFDLAQCYRFGVGGVERDEEKAADLYKQVGEEIRLKILSDRVVEQQELTLFKAEFDNGRMTIDSLTAAANAGDSLARFNLAQCYKFGVGVVNRDQRKAASLYRGLAREFSLSEIHTKARFNMAELLRQLRIAPEDDQKIFKSLEDVFSEYDPEILKRLEVAPECHTEEQVLYRLAADGEHPVAKFRLAESYEDGRIEDDHGQEISAILYERAAEKGHAESQYRIAQRYALGNGVIQNKATALEWHKKAAQENHPESLLYLSQDFDLKSKKSTISPDEKGGYKKDAVKFCDRAIAAGNKHAETFFAKLIEQDLEEFKQQKPNKTVEKANSAEQLKPIEIRSKI